LNTSLRLLVDEDIEDPLADQIQNISAFNVECVRDLIHVRGKPDHEVMVYAGTVKRIVLTMDGGYTKTRFPICTHPGIIRIDSKCKHFSVVSDIVRRFSQCGHRTKAKHAITHLTQDRCRIESADEKPVEISY
jgi:predicted nuclease of predicted toxin-antitoxin system